MNRAIRAGVLALACCLGFVRVSSAAPIVYVAPIAATLRAGATQQFTASVYLTTNKSVTWRVNGVLGGNATVGTISTSGLYSAPLVPFTGSVSVKATSVADPRRSASAWITVLNPVPTVSSLSPATVAPGAFTLTINGSGFVPTSTVRSGAVVLTTTWVSPTQLTATGTATLVPGGMMAVKVSNPDPGAAVSSLVPVSIAVPSPVVSAAAAARFLEQTSWGPSPADIARVQQLGFDAYLDEQFSQPASTYPDYPTTVTSLLPVQQRFAMNALSGSDQLRQRVAFSLGQVFVVSGFKEFTPQRYVPYLRLLHDHAFSNYATLLREVTLSPTMGHFLDMVNNEKASTLLRTSPNRNFARELLQLFTTGTDRLNPDATPQLDAQGQPLPAYDEAVVDNLARALTGWTYPTKPGAVPKARNPMYFVGRMESVPASHDTDEKVNLDGTVLPAGQSAEEDLTAVLDSILHHPNVGPFLALRLIQGLVTSNPSPAYVQRVSEAFAAGGGDMRGVIKAIVLDPEARRGDAPGAVTPTDGHLREPVLYGLALLRTLGATVNETSTMVNIMSPAGQSLFYPPSVFNYFSPLHVLPGYGIKAPEFQILTPSTAVYRANLAYYATFVPEGAGIVMDISHFEPLANDPALLVEAVNRALLFGRMSPAMRSSVETAVAVVTNLAPRTRVETALYLVASSSEYQVQR